MPRSRTSGRRGGSCDTGVVSKWRYTVLGWLVWRAWKRRLRNKLRLFRRCPRELVGGRTSRGALTRARRTRTSRGTVMVAGAPHIPSTSRQRKYELPSLTDARVRSRRRRAVADVFPWATHSRSTYAARTPSASSRRSGGDEPELAESLRIGSESFAVCQLPERRLVPPSVRKLFVCSEWNPG